MEKETEKKDINLKQVILKKLEEEKTQPYSKIWFAFLDVLSWFIWGLLLFVSAVTFSIGLFSFKYSSFLKLANSEVNPLTFFFLPALWFLVVGVFIVMAFSAFRKTRHGYRHPRWLVVIVSVVFCSLVGLLLGQFEIGFKSDNWLGQNADFYDSREKAVIRFWQNPEAGRVLGFFQTEELKVAEVFSDDSEIVFLDVNKNSWQIELDSFSKGDLENIKDKKIVMLIGYKLAPEKFYACQILPWVFGREYSSQELQNISQKIDGYFSTSTILELETNLNNEDKKTLCKNIKIEESKG